MDEFEIKLTGLNKRQRVLADIMWAIPEWDDVEKFIATLPKRERIECEGIVEMMKMELVEGYLSIENTQEANVVIDQFRLTK
jgi:hypothetical protein